ncbi:MAG: ATP-binding protein [Anaerolineales bacterium]
MEKLLDRILSLAAEMLAGQAGLIALVEADGSWNIAASHGIPVSILRSLEPLLAEAPNQKDPRQFKVPEINRLLRTLSRVASLSLLTGVGLPLNARNKVIGLIYIFRSYSGVFSSNDRALLQSFADQAAIAVRNAQLYTQVSREKQRLDALLDSAADGVLILTPDHKIERANQAFAQMLGKTPKELLKLNHEEVIHWLTRRQGVTLEQAEAGGWPLTAHATLYVEGDMDRVNAPPLPVGITYAPLMSSDGALVNIIATIRDITHFREAEELKSMFISVISHELKTPVALIKGYVGTLRRDDATWDRDIVEDSLEVIEEESDRLTELIENLLDASRLQAGGLSLNLTDVDLFGFTTRLTEKFQTQTDRHTIINTIPSDFPIVLADEDRLGQVLSNLLSNAIKYSPEGGEIRIRGYVRTEQVVICVQDQGPGIAPGDIPFVFDRFYRADSATRTTKGTGLGLYLTKAIVEAHGGRIWVDPKPDEGARICFSLPR